MILAPGIRPYLASLVSLGLIAATWVGVKTLREAYGDPIAYHAAVRAMANRLPDRVGDWASVAMPPPADSSVRELNLLVAREFRNEATGQRATLLIVQGRDANEIQGYWPPERFPAEGWTLRTTQQHSIRVQSLMIPVTVYQFTIESFDRYSEIVVYNFLMRPGGMLLSGRAGVHEAEDDPHMRVFGEALMQVAFDSSVATDARDEVFRTVVAGARPVMDAVLQGVGR